MRKLLFLCFATLMLTVMALAPAEALSRKNILGRWCGTISIYEITDNSLKVTWPSDNMSKTHVITDFDVESERIVMHWTSSDDGKRYTTQFIRFSDDGQTMFQIEGGRPFKRC